MERNCFSAVNTLKLTFAAVTPLAIFTAALSSWAIGGRYAPAAMLHTLRKLFHRVLPPPYTLDMFITWLRKCLYESRVFRSLLNSANAAHRSICCTWSSITLNASAPITSRARLLRLRLMMLPVEVAGRAVSVVSSATSTSSILALASIFNGK